MQALAKPQKLDLIRLYRLHVAPPFTCSNTAISLIDFLAGQPAELPIVLLFSRAPLIARSFFANTNITFRIAKQLPVATFPIQTESIALPSVITPVVKTFSNLLNS
jgi:hypothetical protein